MGVLAPSAPLLDRLTSTPATPPTVTPAVVGAGTDRDSTYAARVTPSSEDRHDLPAEDARIAAHLARAERQARLRDVSRLPTAVRSVRAFALDTLADYRRAGRFPRNHVAHARTPIFIDPHGTRCAMAHLLERIGAGELVARVARTANEARVHALAADGELLRWLGAMGLSVEEAAAIQPTYCYTPKAACWCGGEPSTFDFLVTGTLATSAGAQRTVHVDAVHRGASVKIGEDLAVDHTNATDGEHVVVTGMTLSGARNNGAVIPSDQYAFTPCAPIVAQLPLSEAEVLAALESTDCLAALKAKDARYGGSVCTETSAPPAANGCSHGAGGSLSALAVVVAAGVAVARRRRR